MTDESLRLFERIHGHLGWLAVAALVHPVILLRNPRRRARLSVALAASLVTATAILGGAIYGPYSRHVRRKVYLASAQMGLLFERKEHLAVLAVALAWAGCALHFITPDGSLSRARSVRIAFTVAAVVTTIVAALGTRVAAFVSFP